MAQVRITELPESLTLDDESVFPMVYNMVTQKITFQSLKQVMLYFTGVTYDEQTGKFTFTRSNESASILSTTLNKAFKKAEIIDSDIVFTDFSGKTYTVDLMTEELTEKLVEINSKIETNKQNIQKNTNDIATNKSNIEKNASDIKAINDSKGEPNGFAELDSNGQVLASQLPSYVDDVVEGYLYNGKFYKDSSYTTEIIGESGKIYVDLVTQKTYRWTGTIFTVISETLALGETSSTAYRGDRGKTAYDHSQTIGNPHNTTKADIGLGNVDNTADADKVVKEAKKTTRTLTIQKNGTNINTFNGSSDITANITVPTKTSELTNDSDFVNSQGTVAVANKVGTSTVGGSTTPVYINEGTPTSIGYSISKSVPADAVFTDTTYSNATQSKAGLMSALDKIKLDKVSDDADTVEWQQNVNTGVNIASVTINGVKTEIYAPTSSSSPYKGDMEKSIYDVNDDGIVDLATKLETTRTIYLTGHTEGNGDFDGSANLSIITKNPFRYTIKNYNSSSQPIYYPIAKLPIDNASNACSIIINGRIGGWTNLSQSKIDLIMTNRADATGKYIGSSGCLKGAYSNSKTYMDIVAYNQDDKSCIVYLKCSSYYAFDVTVDYAFNSVKNYDGSYIEIPTGTLIWSMNDAQSIIKIDQQGNINANSLSGNASSATKATQDSAGQQINTTYVKELTIDDDNNINFVKGDGSISILPKLNIYSQDKVEIGTWGENKIYRQVLTGSIEEAKELIIPLNLKYVPEHILIEGSYYFKNKEEGTNPRSGVICPINLYNPTLNKAAYCYYNNDVLKAYCGFAAAYYEIVITYS